jgi:Plasmid pRiA4b ORF-3-like protein
MLNTKSRQSSPDPAAARYQVRIDLCELKPVVWRRLSLSGWITLDQLHRAVQCAFGWSDTHLHEFVIDGARFGVPDSHYRDDALINEVGVRLRELLEDGFDEFIYVYDFGDNWEHSIRIEKLLPADPLMPYAICLAGKNACPLEDIGGPSGHAQFLRAIANPKHRRHQEFEHWSGGAYDSRRFDIERVNDWLRKSAS